jgi:hypothetical protein
MSTPDRYSPEQVLAVLAQVWPHRSQEKRIERLATVPLTQWLDWISPLGADTAVFSFACRRIEDMFGFTSGSEDWSSLATSTASVGDLAEFIAARAPRRLIKPVNILGRKCDKAAIFRMLEETTHELVGAGVAIGPSTPLADALKKDQIEKLLTRARLYFPYLRSAKELWYRSRLSKFAEICVGTIILLTAISVAAGLGKEVSTFGSILGGLTAWGALLLILAILVVLPILFIARWALRMNTGPLSGRIRTYRDLVEILNRQKQNVFD